ncbi:MAG: hypothetical protein PUJ42_05135, partial [Bacteroidales bacterium]|nr:hypothetical protein [Bacteroidales bacterium]
MDIYANVFDKPDEQRTSLLGTMPWRENVCVYTNMQSIAYATYVLAITGGHVHDCQQETITIQYTQRNMSLKIVVLAKQVPDTRNVGPDAMTPEG